MSTQLVVKNIVFIGNFIPQNFDKYFFLKNNLLAEHDILKSSIFSSDFCFIQTKSVTIQITAMQFIVADIEPEGMQDIDELCKRIVEYSKVSAVAAGVNFHFYKFSGDQTHLLTKEYFYSNTNQLNEFFQGDDVNYGYYISKDFHNSRLKLDIKPATVQNLETTLHEKLIQFQFNFHIDFDNEVQDNLTSIIGDYQLYYREAAKIMTTYE